MRALVALFALCLPLFAHAGAPTAEAVKIKAAQPTYKQMTPRQVNSKAFKQLEATHSYRDVELQPSVRMFYNNAMVVTGGHYKGRIITVDSTDEAAGKPGAKAVFRISPAK